MTFDYELKLISYVQGKNDMGDVVNAETETTILCDVLSIQRTEFYQADASGLKPEIIFVVNKYEYEGQKDVVFEGKRYSVIRAYAPKKVKGIADFDNLELTCTGLVNSGAT